jgi:hypothetical protein
MVESAGVFSDDGVVVMETIGVTTLHPRGLGNPKLPTPPEAASPLPEDSSRTVCKDSDPLCTIPTHTVCKDGDPLCTKADGFTWSESNTCQVVVVGNEGEFR